MTIGIIGGGASGIMASAGGRFTTRTRAEVAEDGQTEYIIPVQKEAIAVPLLRQLLSELSASARESVLGRPASAAGLLSAAPALSAAGAGAPASLVQAPVNITVNAAASQAEAVGRSVYDLAEHYLQRTLKGALS